MLQENLLQIIELAEKEGKTELDLSGEQLKTLPPEIGKLTQLKKLIFGKYQYDEEGDVIGYIRNNLRVLPVEIGLLHNLEELQIVANKLSSLPSEIGQLTDLQFLHLDGNKLSSLPSEIVQLTNLQSLHLDGNKLSSLPSEIVQLTNLQSLHLNSNKLSSLPSEIVQLTNLQSLHLNSNKLSSLPSEYEFMPKGILTRFIVETYPWIEQQSLVWRSGVVLSKRFSPIRFTVNYGRQWQVQKQVIIMCACAWCLNLLS